MIPVLEFIPESDFLHLQQMESRCYDSLTGMDYGIRFSS